MDNWTAFGETIGFTTFTFFIVLVILHSLGQLTDPFLLKKCKPKFEYDFEILTECGPEPKLEDTYHFGVVCKALPWDKIGNYLNNRAAMGWELTTDHVFVGNTRVEHRLHWRRKLG